MVFDRVKADTSVDCDSLDVITTARDSVPAGLQQQGTVFPLDYNSNGQCSRWITTAWDSVPAGLQQQTTVFPLDYNNQGQCSRWITTAWDSVPA